MTWSISHAFHIFGALYPVTTYQYILTTHCIKPFPYISQDIIISLTLSQNIQNNSRYKGNKLQNIWVSFDKLQNGAILKKYKINVL